MQRIADRKLDRLTRGLVRALAAALALAAVPATAAPACRAAVPAAIGAGPATWIGPCPRGRAEGDGVLRAPRDGTTRLFFGRMRAGRPQSGVMTSARGDYLPAWRFTPDLAALDDPSGDRAASVRTFDTAADGARAASARLRRTGNRASAAFYAARARELATALD